MTDLERVLQLIETLEERVKIAEAKAELAMQHSQILADIVKGEHICQALN